PRPPRRQGTVTQRPALRWRLREAALGIPQARLRQAPLFRPGAAIHQPDPQRASAGGGEHLRAGPAPPVLDLLMRMAETVAVARRHERVPGAGGIDER